MDDVADGKLRDLSRLGARDIGHSDDSCRYMSRAGARANLCPDALLKLAGELCAFGQTYEQYDPDIAVPILTDAKRLGDFRQLLDLIVDFRSSDPHAARIERGIGAPMDD